jgi:hypothetical protein
MTTVHNDYKCVQKSLSLLALIKCNKVERWNCSVGKILKNGEALNDY